MTESKKIDPKYAITFSDRNIRDVREVAKERAIEVIRIFRAVERRSEGTWIGRFTPHAYGIHFTIEGLDHRNHFINPLSMEDWLFLRLATIDVVHELMLKEG